MSIDNVELQQELQRRQVQDEAAFRDTARARAIAKTVLVGGWIAPVIPIVGLLGLFISFWAGIGTGIYLLIAGARKSGFRFLLAGFASPFLAIVWGLIYLVLGVGGSRLANLF